jgi:sugar phosphate isomerase/epimerase
VSKAMTRREFLMISGLAGAALTMGSTSEGKKQTDAVLRISSQEGIIPGASLEEKIAKMEKWGIEGLEVGGRGLKDRVKELKSALANTNVKISAICAGFEGALISEEESEREKCRRSMKEILIAAGELGSTGLIFVPAFNHQKPLPFVEARKVLIDQLHELAEYAVSCGTRLLMEPLNRNEAWFLRLLADAAAICRDVDHPGACMMGDFYHMCIEETSDMGAFLSAGKYLHHVHLASRTRKLPGQDDRDFIDGFRGLKMIGYKDFCSFECGVLGDREVEIPKSVKFLREQWSKATI